MGIQDQAWRSLIHPAPELTDKIYEEARNHLRGSNPNRDLINSLMQKFFQELLAEKMLRARAPAALRRHCRDIANLLENRRAQTNRRFPLSDDARRLAESLGSAAEEARQTLERIPRGFPGAKNRAVTHLVYELDKIVFDCTGERTGRSEKTVNGCNPRAFIRLIVGIASNGLEVRGVESAIRNLRPKRRRTPRIYCMPLPGELPETKAELAALLRRLESLCVELLRTGSGIGPEPENVVGHQTVAASAAGS